MMNTFRSWAANAAARWQVVVIFPVPPFKFETAMIRGLVMKPIGGVVGV